MIMKAKNGYVYQRIHDALIMGDEIILGIDYSTGIARIDKSEYYQEIIDPNDYTWHEQKKYQIKFAPIDLLELLKEVPAMIDYVNTLTVYSDEFGNQYLYVNYFVDMEKELCERYGAIITERNNI